MENVHIPGVWQRVRLIVLIEKSFVKHDCAKSYTHAKRLWRCVEINKHKIILNYYLYKPSLPLSCGFVASMMNKMNI